MLFRFSSNTSMRHLRRVILGLSVYALVLGTAVTAGQRDVTVMAKSAGLPRIGRGDTLIQMEARRLGPLPSPVWTYIYNESDVGVLNWEIFTNRSWLSTSPGMAVANSTDVAIWLVNTEAALGTHTGHLVISSTNAVNEPETIWVELNMLCPVAITGDVNDDGKISQSDIIYLVNYILRAGSTPIPVRESGDVNCDENVSQADIIYLVNHVLRAGPSPCNVCQFF